MDNESWMERVRREEVLKDLIEQSTTLIKHPPLKFYKEHSYMQRPTPRPIELQLLNSTIPTAVRISVLCPL